jgi:hypothetical protein
MLASVDALSTITISSTSPAMAETQAVRNEPAL